MPRHARPALSLLLLLAIPLSGQSALDEMLSGIRTYLLKQPVLAKPLPAHPLLLLADRCDPARPRETLVLLSYRKLNCAAWPGIRVIAPRLIHPAKRERIFNGHAEASRYLGEVRAIAAISAFTRAEVLTGFDAGALAGAKRLLDIFPVLAIDTEVADEAALLRRQYRGKLPDAFQAATARIHKLQFATRNTRDFPPATFSFVTIPYTL